MSSAEPKEHRLSANGIEQCVFEWGAEHRGKEPSLVLTHATGFHARVWDQTIQRLGTRHILSVDQRGHGRSSNTPFKNWIDFGKDFVGVLHHFGLTDTIGVGHSMGGYAAVTAAALDPALFQRLVLFDPVIMPPNAYEGVESIPGGRGEDEHPTAKRKNDFASPEEMIERFADREPFSLFDPAVLRDYCVHGLLPAPDGNGFELACPPSFEASIYISARDTPGIYDSVHKIGVPVKVVRAMTPKADKDRFDFTFSPTWPALAREFAMGTDVHLPELTHFIPMQDPELTARHILD